MTRNFFLILIGWLFLVGVPIVLASYLPQAKLSGIGIKIADFVAPPTPELQAVAQFYQPIETTFNWTAVSDYQQTHPPVGYELRLDRALYQTADTSQVVDLALYQEGEHQVSVRACDATGNCSAWSSQKQLWIDGQPPSGKLLVDNFEVREAVNDDWLLVGDGDYSQGVWQIGSATSRNQLGKNYLSFSLNNQPPLKLLTFEFQQLSLEKLTEFDQFGLVVKVNGREVLLEKRRVGGQWQRAWVDLSQAGENQVEIQILAGNLGDDVSPSWLEVKNVSTRWVVARDLAQIQLSVSDNYDATPSSGLIEAENKVGFWLKDAAGNLSDLNYFPFLKDQQAPEFLSLEFNAQPEGLPDNYLGFEAVDNSGWWDWQVLDDLGNKVEVGQIFSGGQLFSHLRMTSGLVQQIKLPRLVDANWIIELRDLVGNTIQKKLLE